MDLQKTLDESGYTKAKKELEEAKEALAFAKANLAAGIQPNVPLTQFLADLAEMELRIPEMEKALATEYAATVKYVDAQNDLDLSMLDMEEHAELVLEYMEKDHADSPVTDQVRDIVEKIRNNEE
jgi:outer membrane protein TolC